MINIKDIQARLRDNPEPPEVTHIRDVITTAYKDLVFEEGPHKYFLHGTQLPSVSSITSEFSPKEDWDMIAGSYAKRHGDTKEHVQRLWHENNLIATTSGTAAHLYGENVFKMLWDLRDAVGGDPSRGSFLSSEMQSRYQDGYLVPASPKQAAVSKYLEKMWGINNVYPVLAECATHSVTGDEETLLSRPFAGTFDILWAIKMDDGLTFKLAIHDYKTNGSLTNDFNRSHKRYLLSPFGDMTDEPLSHYTLQLSAYELNLLRLRDLGVPEVIDRRLIWLKDDAEFEMVKLPSVAEKLNDILR